MRASTLLEQGEGILWLEPCWVPRAAFRAGRRLKLRSTDLYAFGAHRGAINTRWLSSTTPADNGPCAPPDEGLSYVLSQQGSKTQRQLLREVVSELGAQLIGPQLWERFGRWPVLSKLFDFLGPLPFHLHLRREHAQLTGREPKPEGYYFPPQLNAHEGEFPYTFFGLSPQTTPQQVRQRLEQWDAGDNRITELSMAYRLEVGSGWFVPAGILHAPGSLVTYEPQWGSDVGSVFQSVVDGFPLSRSALVKDVPEAKHDDLDFLVSLPDWQTNTRSDFKSAYFRVRQPADPLDSTRDVGYEEYWITYGDEAFGAKELTVLPGRAVTVRDAGAYGLIAIQGHGRLGRWPVESPTVIRFGEPTQDEYFVSSEAASAGVIVRNESEVEPLVLLKHFAATSETLRLASQVEGER